MSENIFDLLAHSIADPDAIATETETGELIRYGDLVARTGRMAHALAGMGLRPGDRLAAQVEKSPEAALLYTSGTTGRSKGAMLSNGNLSSNAATLCGVWRFGPRDVLIHALPIFHTHGLFVATNVTLLSGASMILLPKFDPARVLSLMARANVLMGVPTFYVWLLGEAGLNREAASPMRLFVSGSAPLLEDTHRSWVARTGAAPSYRRAASA